MRTLKYLEIQKLLEYFDVHIMNNKKNCRIKIKIDTNHSTQLISNPFISYPLPRYP